MAKEKKKKEEDLGIDFGIGKLSLGFPSTSSAKSTISPTGLEPSSPPWRDGSTPSPSPSSSSYASPSTSWATPSLRCGTA